MDPSYIAQDIVRCDLCDTPDPTQHCDMCDIHLCEVCVGKHLSDKSTKHIVVPFSKRGTTFKCPEHFYKICEVYCKSCDIQLCTICVAAGEHKLHEQEDIVKALASKKTNTRKFLQGVKELMFSKDQQTATSNPLNNADEQTYTGEPRVLKRIFTHNKIFRSVSCLNDRMFWTCGQGDNFMRLYNLQGVHMESIKTKSWFGAWDIAVSTNGNLVYTDLIDGSINQVINGSVETLVRLWGWNPYSLCSTSSGDLLVIMDSEDRTQTRVVRYSGAREIQSIQWDDLNRPLYSRSVYKSLCENRNFNICVTVCEAHEVVVVCAAGELRFKYTSPPSIALEPFDPVGITTDSNRNILIADHNSDRIHIIDQDGQFLRYIDKCTLQPWSLCMDSRDNLFVTETKTGILKKIQYK